jgi:hypothetical protein
MLLALDPKHRLDPEVFSPALVEFFEKVRTEAGLHEEKKDDAAKDTHAASDPPGPDGGAGPGQKAEIEIKPVHANPPLALAFVPLGIGQFNNHQPVRGALFAAAELGLFATSLTTFLMFNGLKLPDDQRPPSCSPDSACFKNQDDANTASTLQTIQLVTFWTGIAVTAIGIIEALVSYPGEMPLDAQSAVHTGPGKASFELRF